MKKISIAFISTLFVLATQSCSKSKVSQPASTMEVNEFLNVVAAANLNYTVSLYIKDGDTSTADFEGYVFTFKTNGYFNR